jgi:hypothetical protein
VPILPTQEVPSPMTTIPAIEPLVRVPAPEPDPAQVVRALETHAPVMQPPAAPPVAPAAPIELVEAELVEPIIPIPDGVNPQKDPKPKKSRGKRKPPKEGA